MAGNFLQAALDLLGRPGNAVRGAVIDGPQGAMQGITGQRQYDPTELPGINQLPDQGLSLGPLHLTPRTVGGFAAGAALDPLSYVGGFGVGHAGEGLSKGLELLDTVSPPAVAHAGEVLDKMGPGAQRLAGRIPTSDSILSSVGYGGDAMSDPIEKLIEHANSITPGHEIVADSPEAAESAVAQQTGSEAGSRATTRLSLTKDSSLEDLDPRTGEPLHTNMAPNAEATPVGDQRYAQDLNRLGQTQAQLGELNGKAIPARQWLTETSTGTTPSSAQSWEDVVGVPRGTPVDAMRPDNTTVVNRKVKGGEADFAGRDTGPDMSQGPGLTSKYNGETVGFSRQEVMNHLSALENQIADITAQLKGTGGQFGKVEGKLVPLRELSDTKADRGLENYVSDRQAVRQLQGSPELQGAREDLARTSTSSRPGLSPKQDTLAYIKAGANKLSIDESDVRKLNNQFRDRPESVQGVSDAGGNTALVRTQPRSLSAEDEANLPMYEPDTRAPHGDPLEEDRARRESQGKFGRRSAGTYSLDDDLGHMDNQRGPGAGGVRGQYESGDVGTGTGQDAAGRFRPGEAPVHITGTSASEPTSARPNPPRGQEAQARATELDKDGKPIVRSEPGVLDEAQAMRELQMLRDMVVRRVSPNAQADMGMRSPAATQQFLRYLTSRGLPTR